MSNCIYKIPRSDFNSNCSCFNIMRSIIIIKNDGIMKTKEDTNPTEIITGW